ncbi:MAG: hypothetical protein QXK12_08325 [Candidatus Nezhaarchaeales archaeon]
MMNLPAIIGVGRTKFGEHYDKDPEALIEEAGLEALDSAGLERRHIECCFFSNYFLQLTNKVGLEEGFMSELLELHVPMENSRSFSSALFNAYHALMSGRFKIALVGGVEKLTDRWDKVRDDLMLLEDPWSYYAGGTPEANHVLMLKQYVKQNKLGEAERMKLLTGLAKISVKNHAYGAENRYAHFYGRRISVEEVIKARNPEPLGLYDFAPVSDGAAAAIVTTAELAKQYTDKPVYVKGFASSTDFVSFASRPDKIGFLSTRIAVSEALKMAHLYPTSIGLAEVYDQSTLMEMVALEDLGFIRKGKAWEIVYESLKGVKEPYSINGRKLYVNTSGGRKADGNPLGASGGAQIYEVVKQLKGEAGPRQVDLDVAMGLVLEHEGFGTKAYVHILEAGRP